MSLRAEKENNENIEINNQRINRNRRNTLCINYSDVSKSRVGSNEIYRVVRGGRAM